MEVSILSRDAVKEIDRRAVDQFRVPGIVLMENAGRQCADVLCRLGIRGPVVICCGSGNNAGDGLVIGATWTCADSPYSCCSGPIRENSAATPPSTTRSPCARNCP